MSLNNEIDSKSEFGLVYDRINLDPAIKIKYVNTKQKLADIRTKVTVSTERWTQWLMLFNLMPHHKFAQSEFVVTAAFSCTSSLMSKRSGNFVDRTINANAELERYMIAKITEQSTHADPAPNASENRLRKFCDGKDQSRDDFSEVISTNNG